jgi:hypothetical protein
MAEDTVTPCPGHVRLKLETATGRSMYVGPFATLGGARRLAEDLIGGGAVRSALVQHRNRGTWRPAWGWLASACLLVLRLSGCATFKNTPQQDYVYAIAGPCEGNGVNILGVSPDGKSWRGSWVGGACTWSEFQQCVREQIKAHPYLQWIQGAR